MNNSGLARRDATETMWPNLLLCFFDGHTKQQRTNLVTFEAFVMQVTLELFTNGMSVSSPVRYL